MPKREALEQYPSTGNVFADLGLADAGEHLIKAGLVVRIDHPRAKAGPASRGTAQGVSISPKS
jgi:hypothetical protein